MRTAVFVDDYFRSNITPCGGDNERVEYSESGAEKPGDKINKQAEYVTQAGTVNQTVYPEPHGENGKDA